jgi:hypothetical protein
VGTPVCSDGWAADGRGSCERTATNTHSWARLEAVGFTATQLQTYEDAGYDFHKERIAEVGTALVARGFTPDEIDALIHEHGAVDRGASAAVDAAILYVIGEQPKEYHSLGDGKLTERYNEENESLALDIGWGTMLACTVVGMNYGGPLWISNDSDASDVGKIIFLSGVGCLAAGGILGWVDSMDIGALPEGFLDHEDIGVIRQRFREDVRSLSEAGYWERTRGGSVVSVGGRFAF